MTKIPFFLPTIVKSAIGLVLFSLILISCSTTPTHVGTPMITEKGHEYSIKDTEDGFIVAGHFSEYQFVRNSQKGFTGCMWVINNAAKEYARSKGKEVDLPKWDEIEIIDHGRDIVTAIMNVNCRCEYEFISDDSDDLVTGLERLKKLHDAGAITDYEYQKAKVKLLRSK